jgi:hypothetical protein
MRSILPQHPTYQDSTIGWSKLDDETILTVQIHSPSPIWAPIFDTRKDKDGVFRGGHGYWRSGRILQVLDPSQ